MRLSKWILLSFFAFAFACAPGLQPDPILVPDTLPIPAELGAIRVALVLGGGGARGIAHAGVLEVLEQAQVPIDLIVGSSAGSVIGALYADEPHAQNLKKKVIALNRGDLIDMNWFSGVQMLWRLTGPVEGNALRLFIQKNIRSRDFKELKIPLAVVTTDANKGEVFLIRSGPLAPALHASSAVPMLFNPVFIYGRMLIDGGVASPIPVEIARQFSAKLIIAVDIGTSPDYGPVLSTYQLAMRALHISYFKYSSLQTEHADIVIHPAIDKFGMFDDHANEEMYEAGKEAARQALSKIQQALMTHR